MAVLATGNPPENTGDFSPIRAGGKIAAELALVTFSNLAHIAPIAKEFSAAPAVPRSTGRDLYPQNVASGSDRKGIAVRQG